VIDKDSYIAGLKAAKVMAEWFEDGTAAQVHTEIDVQMWFAEHNGIENGMPIVPNKSVLAVVGEPPCSS
jgi:histidyl-tRNA synthetase